MWTGGRRRSSLINSQVFGLTSRNTRTSTSRPFLENCHQHLRQHLRLRHRHDHCRHQHSPSALGWKQIINICMETLRWRGFRKNQSFKCPASNPHKCRKALINHQYPPPPPNSIHQLTNLSGFVAHRFQVWMNFIHCVKLLRITYTFELSGACFCFPCFIISILTFLIFHKVLVLAKVLRNCGSFIKPQA